jgi:hypothetical protein
MNATRSHKEVRQLRRLGVRAFLYFIECEEYIKIGVSNDPTRRCTDLNLSVPFQCNLLAVRPCDSPKDSRCLERAYHLAQKEHKVKGEWFRRSPEIDALIAEARETAERYLYVEPIEKLYRISEVARRTGESEQIIRRLIYKGVIKIRRVGPYKAIRVAHSEILRYLDSFAIDKSKTALNSDTQIAQSRQ